MTNETTKFIEEAFKLAPHNNGVVNVYDKETDTYKEKQIYRKYECYGDVPIFDHTVKKSYMYTEPKEIPNLFKPLYNKYADKYNQMIVNWYESDDFIEPHRDCTAKLDMTNPIIVEYFSEGYRNLVFTSVDNKNDSETYELRGHGSYSITDLINSSYRHEIKPGAGRYISFSFRKTKEKKNEDFTN